MNFREKKDNRKDLKNQLRILREIIMDTSVNAADAVDGVVSVKDIKVQINRDDDGLIDKDTEAYIDAYIIVRYGVKIPDVAWSVQTGIRENVKKITQINLKKVNIHIEGVRPEEETITNG